MLNVSIISIGDEVRIGQVVNSNAAWLSSELSKLGAYITKHITIADEPEVMEKTIRSELAVNDIVITTGGLGPTHDDFTKDILLKIFHDKYIFHEATFENIKELFRVRNREITERNRLQAQIPSKATPLNNPVGTAPGLMFQEKGKILFILPGVPAEMQFITRNSILPRIAEIIAQKNDSIVLYKTLNVTGIFESALADLIGEPNSFLGDSTLAFLPSYKGIRLRIGAVAKNFKKAQVEIDRIKTILYSKAGKYIYAEDDTSITNELGRILTEKRLTLSIAESCTAGGLGHEITKVSGSSKFFLGGIISYSNEAKVKLLSVSPNTLVRQGAVSKETAREMARNCRKKFDTDFALSITGIAGPEGGTEEKPVGTVWIGLADRKSTTANLYHFGSDREINRERAIHAALLQLFLKVK
jgi:nicotinamide-nucleotide amidase